MPHCLISWQFPATRIALASHPRLPSSVLPASSHRSLTVVPLIGDQRYYGETTEVSAGGARQVLAPGQEPLGWATFWANGGQHFPRPDNAFIPESQAPGSASIQLAHGSGPRSEEH